MKENITVCVIGGCGFLGQHIVRELQKWNTKQVEYRKRRRSTSISANIGSHGNENSCYVAVNLDSCEDKKSEESDDTDLLTMEEEVEICDFCIKEIRILDIKPLESIFELSDTPPISVKYCDIRMESQMPVELEGVDVVFHCAAATIKDLTKPNENKEDRQKFWETNLEGTENVVWGCRKANVKALIYTSTIAAIMGGQSLVSHTETLSPTVNENELILGDYARSRKRAEDLVIDAHRSTTDNEEELLTTVLRPVALYGEGDTKLIPAFIEMAKRAGGKLPTLGGYLSAHQLTYAGNAAYAHICAMVQLVRKSVHPLRDCGGLPTYVCDDSPVGSPDQILSPFLHNFGLRTSSPTMPVSIILFTTFLMNMWLNFWEKVGWKTKWRASVPSMRLQNLAASATVVNRTRAELSLQYHPIYSWEEAKEVSLSYYERFIENRSLTLEIS